jgi:putative NADPH-quinone reductase
MRVLVVLDHPYTIDSAENVPHRRSLSAAAAAAIRGARRAGHETDLIDLAAENFHPAMTRDDLTAWRHGAAIDPQLLDYQRRLLEADHLVFAFPVWWEAMPAATKGFLDRVLIRGVMYEELPHARGNPFRNRMTRLGGDRALGHDHPGQGLPVVVQRPPHQDPVQRYLRQDRRQKT